MKHVTFSSVALVVAAFGLTGCDNPSDKKPVSAPQERSQIVEAKAGTAAPVQTAQVVQAAASSPPKAPRVLCAGQMSGAGRSVAKKPVSQSVASGEAPLPEGLALGGGFTWVNFWAAWCAPCKEEIPYLESLHGKHAAEGLQIVGVSVDTRGDDAKITEFARDFRMSYAIWRDPDERVNSRFLAIGVPSTYLIDRDGILRWKHLGTLRATTPGFAAALQNVLRERGASN